MTLQEPRTRRHGWRVQHFIAGHWIWDMNCQFYATRAECETALRARRKLHPKEQFRIAFRHKGKPS